MSNVVPLSNSRTTDRARGAQTREVFYRMAPRLAACALLAFLCAAIGSAQSHPLQELTQAARTDSPKLKDLLNAGLPGLHGRDGAAVWGQEFLFAVESEKPASVSIDHQPALNMKNVSGTRLWYRLLTLRLGTTHNYSYFADGKPLGTYDVAGYTPDSYPDREAARRVLSEMKTLPSRIYPGMTAKYWAYVNSG